MTASPSHRQPLDSGESSIADQPPTSAGSQEIAVRAAAVQQLFQSPLPPLANLAVASLLVAAAWGALPGWILAVWLLSMAMVAAARVLLWRSYQRSPAESRDAAAWERRNLLGTAMAALLWAATGAAVAFGGLPLVVEGLIAVSVGGMIAGAMFSMTASTAAFFAYVLPTAVGPIAGFLIVGDANHMAVAGMGMVYLTVVLLWGRQTNRGILDGIRLRLRNEALVAELQAVRQQIDVAEQLKRESFANLGHELRAPLNAIIGFAESLDAELWGPLGSPRYREYARAIGDSGRHLHELIQGILDIARHDAGMLELDERPVDLAELTHRCAGILDGAARDKGVELTVLVPEPATVVNGDATKLRQIVINLVANAVRFTPRGGRVSVVVERGEGGEIEIRVEDDGIGLAAEDIPRALEPFVQVAREGRSNSGGAGLGLPLSKRLAELHGGRLEIESAEGVGTTVRVVLPAYRAIERD